MPPMPAAMLPIVTKSLCVVASMSDVPLHACLRGAQLDVLLTELLDLGLQPSVFRAERQHLVLELRVLGPQCGDLRLVARQVLLELLDLLAQFAPDRCALLPQHVSLG